MFHLLAEILKAIAAPFLLSFQKQPRVRVFCVSGTDERVLAGVESAERLWEMTFEVHNQSSFDAFDMEFLPTSAIVRISPPHRRLRLKAGERKRIVLEIGFAPSSQKSHPEGSFAGHSLLHELDPSELVLRYQNDYRKVFHTRFVKRGERVQYFSLETARNQRNLVPPSRQ